MQSEDRDLELIERILTGAEEEFDELMQRHEALVYRIAYSCTRSPDDALDVAQNVFLKAFQKLSSFRGESSFKSWIGRIAHNESLNWIRKHRRETLLAELPEQAAQGRTTQERRLALREQRDLLESSLERLNPRYRLTLALRYFEGLSLREIAETQDCSIGMVKITIFRSLRQLRAAFAEEGKESRQLLA